MLIRVAKNAISEPDTGFYSDIIPNVGDIILINAEAREVRAREFVINGNRVSVVILYAR